MKPSQKFLTVSHLSETFDVLAGWASNQRTSMRIFDWRVRLHCEGKNSGLNTDRKQAYFLFWSFLFYLLGSIPHELGSESLTLRRTQSRFLGGIRNRRTTTGQIFANILQILSLTAFLLWRSHGTLLCQVQTSSTIDLLMLQVRKVLFI